MKIPIKEIIKAEKFLNRYGISLFLYGYSLDGTEEYAEEYIKSVSNKKELSKSEYEKFRKYIMKTCGNRVSIAYINILMKVLLEGNYPNKLLFDYCSNNFNDDYLQSWFATHPRYNHKGNILERLRTGNYINVEISTFICI